MTDDICLCFGPPVDSCPTHGKKGPWQEHLARPRMETDVGVLMKKLGVDADAFKRAVLEAVVKAVGRRRKK